MARKNDSAIIDRIDSVKQYAYKYLRKDDSLRSKLMIRLLIIAHEQNYNLKAIQRHASDTYKKLLDNPMVLNEGIKEAEIIPYEWLWNYLLDFIETNY